MVTSGVVAERQDLRLGWLWASVCLHAGLIGLIGHVRSTLPHAAPLAPAVLVGTSFEVLLDEAVPSPAVAVVQPPVVTPPGHPQTQRSSVVPEGSRALPSTLSAAAAPAEERVQARPDAALNKPEATLTQKPQREPGTSAASLPTTSSTPLQLGPSKYGQEGKEGAPAQLRRAFIKMLPLAAKLDESWLSLPAMSLGRGRFVLRLNDQGQLASVDLRSGDAHPALVRAMQKNRAFLGTRRFASNTPGERSVVVDVSGSVSQRSQQDSAEGKVIALGVRVDPLDPQAEPRGAYFTYDSGNHVELVWAVVRDP